VSVAIEGQGQGFRSFLVPGIAAMAIMQSGIFSVVFTLVRFKSQGVLRRLNATPIGPSHFLVGQLSTRMIVILLQTYVLIVVGIVVLGITVADGRLSAWLDITLMAIFGGALFISMGLAVSGWAKSEDTAAPVANIITLPMMFLSGVFFPASVLPDWVSTFSQYMPLTYLADGMREITVNGTSIFHLGKELAGLGAWTVASFAIATRLFKWE
jgi:ABC-2 type transport system permease protein